MTKNQTAFAGAGCATIAAVLCIAVIGGDAGLLAAVVAFWAILAWFGKQSYRAPT